MRFPGSGHASGRGAWLLLDLIIAGAVIAVVVREVARSATARSIASFAADVGRRQLHALPENSGYLAGLALGLLLFGVLIVAGIGILALAARVRADPRDITRRH